MRLFLCGVLLAGLAGGGVPAAEAVDLEVVTRIRDEGLNHSEVMDTLKHLTDVIGPRLTGSPPMKTANAWTRDTMAGWGLAQGERADSFCGTAVYMSPEQLAEAGHGLEVDYWALGVLLFEMLHGEPPFSGPNRAVLLRSAHGCSSP